MCLFVHTFVYVCIYVFVYLMFTSSNPGSSLSWPSGIDSAAHSPEKKDSPEKKNNLKKMGEKKRGEDELIRVNWNQVRQIHLA